MQRVRMTPYTSTARYFPLHHPEVLPSLEWPIPRPCTTNNQECQYSDRCLHGDYTKAALMHSQPLTSQREVFDTSDRDGDEVDDDRMPVSEDEIKKCKRSTTMTSKVRPSISTMNRTLHSQRTKPRNKFSAPLIS